LNDAIESGGANLLFINQQTNGLLKNMNTF